MQKSHNDLDIRSKIWIEVGGEPVFGRGRRFLLEAIDSHGSINRAAQEVDISFRKAWSHIKSHGRAARRETGRSADRRQERRRRILTDDARKFLKKYEALEKGIQEIVDKRFRAYSREAPMCDDAHESKTRVP